MATDTTATNVSNAEVMASVDSTPTTTEFIIADISCDDAWLSLRAKDAPTLDEWR